MDKADENNNESGSKDTEVYLQMDPRVPDIGGDRLALLHPDLPDPEHHFVPNEEVVHIIGRADGHGLVGGAADFRSDPPDLDLLLCLLQVACSQLHSHLVL